MEQERRDYMGLITQVDSCFLNEENYEINNGFFSLDFKKTMTNLKERNGGFLGLSKAPWPHNGCWQALVYEDEKDFSLHWCHISDSLINVWEQEMKKANIML